MSSKHFFNDPDHLVLASLHSLTLTNPAVALDRANKIVYRRPTSTASSPPTVSIVSGGGSGHEPAFAGLVGPGMLAAAVAGSIFASPSAEQVHAAITSRIDPEGGVLVVLMNYTGDVLSFGVAVERARAAGLAVEMVVVGDDVGVGRAQAGKVGRRGIAGTVLVHKIAGALAGAGRPIEQVASVARLVAENLVSVGASLAHVHVPGRASAEEKQQQTEQRIGQDEVELGMGIHNEPGCGREPAGDLAGLVTKMLAQLLGRDDPDRAFVHVNSNEVVLLVNNLGGVSPLELGAVTAEVCAQLDADWAIRPVRVLSGSFMTSLNAPGFSVTLLNVVNTDIGGPGMIELLDAPAEVTGWATPIGKHTWEARNQAERTGGGGEPEARQPERPSGLRIDPKTAEAALRRALERVVQVEPEITKFDTVVGDGDCGTCMKRGAEAILNHLGTSPLTGDVVVDLAALTSVVETSMDGTSGALYTIFLSALTSALRVAAGSAGQQQQTETGGETDATQAVWAQALQSASEALARYSPARPGDRTLVDALTPFIEELARGGDVRAAAAAARKGAEGTKGMRPALGRSVYVGGDGWERVPDPGAWGLARFLEGLAGAGGSGGGWGWGKRGPGSPA